MHHRFNHVASYINGCFSITFTPIVACICLQRFIKVHASFDQRTRRCLPAINIFFIIMCTTIAIHQALQTACNFARRRDTIDDISIRRYAKLLGTSLYGLAALLAIVCAIALTIWARTSLQFVAARCLHLPRHQWTTEQISAVRMLHVTCAVQFIVIFELYWLLY
jgi:uncharacterized membrane protein YidH (DUF202 family)